MASKAQPAITIPPPPGAAGAQALRWSGRAALALALLFGLLLGVRLVDSEDLGYHVGFGETFLDTGHIVQTSPEIYTMNSAEHFEPTPGCWYNEQGQFQFVNANWLSQVMMAVVFRAGGMTALSILQALLVASVFVLAILIMRRLGVPVVWMAAGVLLIGMVSYERFQLRPELFTYALLVAALYVLLPGIDGAGDFRWWRILTLWILQVLLVNTHSYPMLGLAMTGAALADQVANLLWRRVTGAPADEAQRLLKRRAGMLGVALAGQCLMCLVNPWTWRLAIMPVQMLEYMRVNHITNPLPGQEPHPLSRVGEFFPPLFGGVFEGTKATYAYVTMLVLGAAAAVGAALRRRWAALAIILMMAAVSWSMRRNIALGAMLLVPLAMYAVHDLLAGRFARLRGPLGRQLAVIIATALAAVSAYYALSVVSSRFYYNEQRATRFGLGLSPFKEAIGPAEWINRNNPQGNVWCDFDSSSAIYFFTHPHRNVPIISNSWTFPPEIMQQLLDFCMGRRPYAPEFDKYDVQVVALRVDPITRPLVRALALDPDWAIVAIEPKHVLYVRKTGPNAALAARDQITRETLNLRQFIAQAKSFDPIPAFALNSAGAVLSDLGWTDRAMEVWRETLLLDGDYADALVRLGTAFAQRATIQMLLMQAYLALNKDDQAESARAAVINDLSHAQGLLERATRREGRNSDAAKDLQLLLTAKSEFEQYKIVVPAELNVPDDYYDRFVELGRELAKRGTVNIMLMQKFQDENNAAEAAAARRQGQADWLQADGMLVRARQSRPADANVKEILRLLRAFKTDFNSGVRVDPKKVK
jgi:hypothetical protein